MNIKISSLDSANSKFFVAAFKDVSVFGDVNLELPSFRSNRSIVEIHLDMNLNKSSGQEIVQEFRTELPLHARYPVSFSLLKCPAKLYPAAFLG